MSNSQDPKVETETLSDDDLDSVSGGDEGAPLQEPNTVAPAY
jgi:bacteriocin-like protein